MRILAKIGIWAGGVLLVGLAGLLGWRFSQPPLEVEVNVYGLGIHRIPALVSLPVTPLETWPLPAGDYLDLRHKDARRIPLAAQLDLLKQVSFDTSTRWPRRLGAFAPRQVMEEGKNPGLGIRELHKSGRTGTGTALAVVGPTLAVTHREFAGRLRHYEEADGVAEQAEPLGTALASLAVGRTVGVAPAANLYYLAVASNPDAAVAQRQYAWAIRRVLTLNKHLPAEAQIRTIAVAGDWPAGGLADAAAAEARANGIFVISSALTRHYGYRLQGVGRDPGSHPDDRSSYYQDPSDGIRVDDMDSIPRLLIPAASRTVADVYSRAGYTFQGQFNLTWPVAFLAGLYVLTLQANPDITPELFLAQAAATGTYVEQAEGREQLGPIVHPRKLIDSVKLAE